MLKKTIYFFLAAAFLLACSPKYTQSSSVNNEASESNVRFALSFFQNANRIVEYDENLLISPYSASVALSMLAEGSDGNTRDEFDDALHGLYKGDNLSSSEEVTVCSANSVWIDEGFKLKDSYSKLLVQDYDAMLVEKDFNDPSTVDAINSWCSDNTEGKINEIIKELSPSDVMVLINALYFNAPWESEFSEDLTVEGKFHGMSGDQTVPMMHKNASFAYAEFQGSQMISIPYAGGKYSMFIVLPPVNWDVNTIIPYINDQMYTAAMQMMSKCKVDLTMPKYKLEASMVLNKALNRMGIWDAFSSEADFSKISSRGPLVLSMVKQKCYIDVSEKGTEAAAVTSAQVSLTSFRPDPVVKMNVDRPFLFFIADTEAENILFVGKVVNL